ncbi:MAG: tetratricopeptide repeat protein, partial [Ectothiorhodospiraceae bacterium]
MRIAHATLLLLPALSACSLGGTPQTIGSLPPPTADTTTADAPLKADPDRAIASYRAYLRDAPPGERRTEAQRRLADLTLERAADEDAASGGGDGPVVPTEVITLYRRLLRENPDGPDSDRIRYQLARALEYNGKREAAVAVLDALVTDNPDSPHYAEAQFRRAEALFSNGKFRSAEAAYTKVAALGPGTGYYDQALYKQGWSRFRQHHLNEAVTAFLELYALETDNGRLSEDALSSARQQRLADTLRAVSLAFAYQSGAASAKDYFQRHGNVPFEDRVYARLGRHYLHEEAWSAAAATYNTFAAEHPLHERAPLFRVKGIDAWSQGGFPGQVLKAKEAFARDYGIPSAFWEKHEPGKHPKVVAALKDTTAELARHYHAAAQDGGDAEDYRQAAAWYRRYIEAFPDDARTPGLNFLLAELLFETKRYAQATVEYEHTAYGYGDNPRAAEAGYAAILAYQRQAERLEAEELDAWHRQQTDSELRFADAFPDHPQAPQVLARAAKSLYERGDRRGAAKAADRFLQRYPDSGAELRRSAFLVAGHSRFELGEYAKAESAYTDALPLTPEAEQAPVKERLAASIYKQGEALREQGKLRAAVKDFLRLGRVVPDADMRPTAEYDAAAALLKLEAWDEAIPVLEGFRRRYPDNELTPEIT